MPTVLPVKFTYATHDLWFDPAETGAQEGDHVICSTARGTEIGLATHDAFEVSEEEITETGGALQSVLRVATEVDLNHADELACKGEAAMPTFRRLVQESELDMKPVGVEYLFGGERVVCYFSAEERVDFRGLVRQLAHELQGKIDMRQIGVREEAAIVGGYAHCGQELCCARFGHQFEPVSIRMAKEQDLPLNSTKISGVCGRLMCCLRYEFEAYRDFKQRAPKKNALIDTPLGKAKIIEYDTPKEQLNLRLENGKHLRVNLADMKASDAARKKSEDLGCPCRPDTVTRDVLERMESPDVQMALAEIDRQNGLVSEPAFSDSDIFVEPRKPRRRNTSTSSDTGDQEQTSSSEATPKKRRRRRSSNSAASQSQQQAGRAAEQQQGGSEAKAKRPRRRHRSASGAAEGQSAQRGGEPISQQQTNSAATRRHKRRPGDKGGQQQAQPNQGTRQRPKAEQGGEAKPKRRRRRHRGGSDKES